MARSHRFALAVSAAGSLFALSFARADTEPGTRAVIRGTGKDVQIVYRAPRTAPLARAAADPVTDALRQKRTGATDQTVLAYLDRHRDEMPDIVGADLLRRFRQAGAGDPVIAFLSTNSAVEIGETAEGGAAVWGLPEEGGAYGGAYPDLVSSGYPFYGGGYGGYGGDGGHRAWGMRGGFRGGHGFHGGFNNRNAFFIRFGNGLGPRPMPHPMSGSRGGMTHAAIAGGAHRR